MGSVLNLRRSEYSVVWLPTEPSVEATMPPPDNRKNDRVPSDEALSAFPNGDDAQPLLDDLQQFEIKAGLASLHFNDSRIIGPCWSMPANHGRAARHLAVRSVAGKFRAGGDM